MKKIQKVNELSPVQYDDLVNRMLAKASADLIHHVLSTSVDRLLIGDIYITPIQLREMLGSIIDLINNYIPDDTEKEDNGCALADC